MLFDLIINSNIPYVIENIGAKNVFHRDGVPSKVLAPRESPSRHCILGLQPIVYQKRTGDYELINYEEFKNLPEGCIPCNATCQVIRLQSKEKGQILSKFADVITKADKGHSTEDNEKIIHLLFQPFGKDKSFEDIQDFREQILNLKADETLTLDKGLELLGINRRRESTFIKLRRNLGYTKPLSEIPISNSRHMIDVSEEAGIKKVRAALKNNEWVVSAHDVLRINTRGKAPSLTTILCLASEHLSQNQIRELIQSIAEAKDKGPQLISNLNKLMGEFKLPSLGSAVYNDRASKLAVLIDINSYIDRHET